MSDLNATLQAVENILQQASDLANRDAALKQLGELIAGMARNGTTRDHPVREIPARLSDRWSTLLLLLLRTGSYRHSTLRRLVGTLSVEGKISQRMLTLRLRTLERDGFITRHTTNTHPPGMEYELTALGRSLLEQIDQLMEWVRQHSPQIIVAREQFNQRSAAFKDKDAE
jgi:DNA-binding HxlR family transcriptional regulator